MGEPTSQPASVIPHFSHPHPLLLSYNNSQVSWFPVVCSCCKQTASGWIYACNLCNYFIHVPCCQMPQQVTHPFDQNHVLTLLSTPPYQEGSFKCDACGKKGDGFSYHCSTCKIDLHPNCASIPMILTHQFHHHQLNLTFSVPYQSKMFSCNVCKNIQGCEQWLYRCNLCGFDAHLDCAIPKVEQARYSGQVPYQQQVPLQSPQPQHYQTSLTPAFPIQQTMGSLLSTTVTSVIAGAAQSFGQILAHTIFGDGDAGGGGDGGAGGGGDGGSGGF